MTFDKEDFSNIADLEFMLGDGASIATGLFYAAHDEKMWRRSRRRTQDALKFDARRRIPPQSRSSFWMPHSVFADVLVAAVGHVDGNLEWFVQRLKAWKVDAQSRQSVGKVVNPDSVSRAIEELEQTALWARLDHEFALETAVLASWVDDNCSRIVVSSKALARRFTRPLPKRHVKSVIAPWSTFVLDVPAGVIFGDRPETRQHEVRHILVNHHGDRWMYFALTDGNYTETAGWQDRKAFFSREATPGVESTIASYVANVCFAMAQGSGVEPIGRGHASPREPRQDSTANTPTIPRFFRIVRDVIVWRRKTVDPSDSGPSCEGRRTRGPQRVQSTTRSHSRMQPWGPGRARVKQIVVAAYRTGPQDGPIALRKHKLRP